MKRPNILVIQADQMAPQALPVYGHPLFKAPNIQALADRGVVFENAYCNFPLCVPPGSARALLPLRRQDGSVS